jgi:hypothetical protein
MDHLTLVTIVYLSRVLVFLVACFLTVNFISQIVVQGLEQIYNIVVKNGLSVSIGLIFLFGLPIAWTVFLALMLLKI